MALEKRGSIFNLTRKSARKSISKAVPRRGAADLLYIVGGFTLQAHFRFSSNILENWGSHLMRKCITWNIS